ncbi:MAG: winged helix DNA-binding domain-containing protein [Chitinophagales bacterium]
MSTKSLNIATRRLIAQQLSGTSIRNAAEMVSWFGAVQGQEYVQTKWGLGLRLAGHTDQTIEKELSDAKILRTHLLRPTWHFVNAEDIRWILGLSAASVQAVNAYMYKKLELDFTLFRKTNQIMEKILNKNGEMTREEINDEFRKSKIFAEGHRLSYVMMQAELEGIICSGAKRGNQFTYSLLSNRVAKGKSLPNDLALAELTKRYFQSRGPATLKDFSTWSGLSIKDCKKGVEMIRSSLEKMASEDGDCYFFREINSERDFSGLIHLLPIYDEYIMGYKDRTAIFEYKNRLKEASPIRHDCMIIYEGQIIGSWKRTIGKKQIDLYYDLYKPISNKQKKAFEGAIALFGDFNGLTINLKKTG